MRSWLIIIRTILNAQIKFITIVTRWTTLLRALIRNFFWAWSNGPKVRPARNKYLLKSIFKPDSSMNKRRWTPEGENSTKSRNWSNCLFKVAQMPNMSRMISPSLSLSLEAVQDETKDVRSQMQLKVKLTCAFGKTTAFIIIYTWLPERVQSKSYLKQF